MAEGRLKGKIALVTGASRGIGRATALLFAQEGAGVAVNYLKSLKHASEVVDSIRKAGGQAIAVRADVSQKAEVTSMAEAVMGEFGKIDILVNNAGVLDSSDFSGLSEESLDRLMAVNVKGVVYCAQSVAPHMIERRYGKIINLGSIAGLGTAMPGTTPYALTKAAVASFTKRLAFELGPHGINVNAICPGVIPTDMVTDATPPDKLEAKLEVWAKRAMLGRVGRAEEVAHAALFLASDESSFVTAQLLTVDGGRMDFFSHSG